MSTWMKHPNLPGDQLIQVPDDAVPGHHRSGWEITDPPPPEPTAGDLESTAAQDSDLDTAVAAVEERPTETDNAADGKES